MAPLHRREAHQETGARPCGCAPVAVIPSQSRRTGSYPRCAPCSHGRSRYCGTLRSSLRRHPVADARYSVWVRDPAREGGLSLTTICVTAVLGGKVRGVRVRDGGHDCPRRWLPPVANAVRALPLALGKYRGRPIARVTRCGHRSTSLDASCPILFVLISSSSGLQGSGCKSCRPPFWAGNRESASRLRAPRFRTPNRTWRLSLRIHHTPNKSDPWIAQVRVPGSPGFLTFGATSTNPQGSPIWTPMTFRLHSVGYQTPLQPKLPLLSLEGHHPSSH